MVKPKIIRTYRDSNGIVIDVVKKGDIGVHIPRVYSRTKKRWISAWKTKQIKIRL